MNDVNTFSIAILTDASGNFEDKTTPIKGKLLQLRYVPDGSSPLATGADITIIGQSTGFAYYSQSNIGTSAFQKAPRQPIHNDAGVASLYAAAGEPVEDFMYIDEQLTVTVAQGGNALQGTLYLWVG